MSEVKERKKPGRPRKPDGLLRDYVLTLRLRGDLKETLRARAEQNGRSQSEEAEHLIATAFAAENLAPLIRQIIREELRAVPSLVKLKQVV